MRSPEEMWWLDSVGPQNIVDTVCGKFFSGERSVVILIDDNMAFRHEMREEILNRIRGDDECVYFERVEIDCDDEMSNADEIASLVWRKVNPDREMLLRGGERYIDCFVREKCLSEKILWIKGIKNEGVFRNLSSFVRMYAKKAKDKCFIVLETTLEMIPDDRGRTLPVIDTCSMLRNIDMMLYATMLFRGKDGGVNKSGLLVRYVGNLVASICGQDAELAAHLTGSTDFVNDDIVSRLRDILKSDVFPNVRGEKFVKGRAVHPFYLLRNDKEQYLRREINSAQIQTFFSFVEELRFDYIEKYRDVLQRAIDNRQLFNASGRNYPVTDMFDAELGAISHCIKDENIDGLQQALDDLDMLREIRNDLAHHKSLSVDKLNYLFDRYDQFERTVPTNW